MACTHKGIPETMEAHERYLARRRAAYRYAHPKEKLTDSQEEEHKNELKEAQDKRREASRNDHLKLWTFTCNSGLRLNTHSPNTLDYQEQDHLEALYSMKGFKYSFYRVSAASDLLRGYVCFNTEVTMEALNKACPWLDFARPWSKRYLLTRWVCGTVNDNRLGKLFCKGQFKII